MILVLTGTNPYQFTRLLQAVDAWARASGERVIAQTGHTSISGLVIECHPFVSHERIVEWIKQAAVVISQGGMGSLMDCLKAGKVPIAVPRRPELGESQDLQNELVEALAEEGKVIALSDLNNLSESIQKAKGLSLKATWESRIPRLVAEKVESIL